MEKRQTKQLIHCNAVKNLQTWVFVFFLIIYISLVGLVTIANGQIEWIQSTNFNRIQDRTSLTSSCV